MYSIEFSYDFTFINAVFDYAITFQDILQVLIMGYCFVINW